MSLRTALARARGHGSAKQGVGHWWMQRLTAVALVPLLLWLVASLIAHVGADHETVVAWMRSPVVAVGLLLLVGALFHHGQLGVQVVIEDYVHHEGLKIVSLVAVKFAALTLAVAAAFAVLSVALGR